jgi:hypothetical protein
MADFKNILSGLKALNVDTSVQGELELDAIANNPDSQVIISIINGNSVISIKGFHNQPFGIGGGNQFNAPSENTFQDINNAYGAIRNSTDKIGLSNYLPSAILLNQSDTILQWIGSNRPAFSVSFFLLSWRPSQNVLTHLKTLLECVNPLHIGNGLDTLGQAPWGYDGTKTDKGNIALTVGRWFHADGLVIKDFHSLPSLEVLPDGDPLWAQVTVNLEASRIEDASVVSEYLGKFDTSGL